MKKTSAVLLIFAIVMSFVACGQNDSVHDDMSQESVTYDFQSYKECLDALTDSAALRKDQDKYGQLYRTLLKEFENGNIPLYVPTYEGKTMELRDEEGFSNITLFTSETYDLPWIWYHCKYNNSDISVRLTYLTVINDEQLKESKTALEFIKKIAPNAPQPDNYQTKDSYKNIYEKELEIGKENVLAMISETKDGKTYSKFLINDVLVTIYDKDTVLTDEFWASFSLTEYK